MSMCVWGSCFCHLHPSRSLQLWWARCLPFRLWTGRIPLIISRRSREPWRLQSMNGWTGLHCKRFVSWDYVQKNMIFFYKRTWSFFKQQLDIVTYLAGGAQCHSIRHHHDAQSMDLLSDQGFANAVYHTLNLKVGAGKMSAPVCSTFVLMSLVCRNVVVLCTMFPNFPAGPLSCLPKPRPRSMGSTLRTKARPLGRPDSIPVQQGNTLCARAIVLLLLCSCKGIFWVLEQPGTSVMEFHPVFQCLLKLLSVRRLQFRMSRFGAPTPKPTVLYSSS